MLVLEHVVTFLMKKNIANNWFLSLQALLYSNILRTRDVIIRDFLVLFNREKEINEKIK